MSDKEKRDEIMRQQEKKLEQQGPKPKGRPLLLGRRKRTYWDSSQEQAFSSENDQSTIVGKIFRDKSSKSPKPEIVTDGGFRMKTERMVMSPMDADNEQEMRMLREIYSDWQETRCIPAPLSEHTAVTTDDDVRQLAKSMAEANAQGKPSLLVVRDKKTEVLIGVAGMWEIAVFKDSRGRVRDDEAFDEQRMEHAYEVGFALRHSAIGKGFATESMWAVYHWALDKLNVDKRQIYAYIDEKKCRSERVLEKIGMQAQKGIHVPYRGEEGHIIRFSFPS